MTARCEHELRGQRCVHQRGHLGLHEAGACLLDSGRGGQSLLWGSSASDGAPVHRPRPLHLNLALEGWVVDALRAEALRKRRSLRALISCVLEEHARRGESP